MNSFGEVKKFNSFLQTSLFFELLIKFCASYSSVVDAISFELKSFLNNFYLLLFWNFAQSDEIWLITETKCRF